MVIAAVSSSWAEFLVGRSAITINMNLDCNYSIPGPWWCRGYSGKSWDNKKNLVLISGLWEVSSDQQFSRKTNLFQCTQKFYYGCFTGNSVVWTSSQNFSFHRAANASLSQLGKVLPQGVTSRFQISFHGESLQSVKPIICKRIFRLCSLTSTTATHYTTDYTFSSGISAQCEDSVVRDGPCSRSISESSLLYPFDPWPTTTCSIDRHGSL